ncbi:MAG: recombinase family protein, partial [Lachnospiraceae bacterium]|nr:recombinase family protein [Lachnospiraceae bacterium]
KNTSVTIDEWEDIKNKIPTWQDVFLNADVATKRVLVNKLVERIDVKKTEVVIRFKINLNDFISQSRICADSLVP